MRYLVLIFALLLPGCKRSGGGSAVSFVAVDTARGRVYASNNIDHAARAGDTSDEWTDRTRMPGAGAPLYLYKCHERPTVLPGETRPPAMVFGSSRPVLADYDGNRPWQEWEWYRGTALRIPDCGTGRCFDYPGTPHIASPQIDVHGTGRDEWGQWHDLTVTRLEYR